MDIYETKIVLFKYPLLCIMLGLYQLILGGLFASGKIFSSFQAFSIYLHIYLYNTKTKNKNMKKLIVSLALIIGFNSCTKQVDSNCERIINKIYNYTSIPNIWEPINQSWWIITEANQYQVDRYTYNRYSIGENFCK